MLKHRSTVLRSGLVAAAAALLPITEAAATGDGANVPTGPGADPLRSCLISLPSYLGGGSVRIFAGGADSLGNPVGPFPLTVNSATDGRCQVDPTHNPTGVCLRWDYQWKYTGVLAPYPNTNFTYVTLDSDLNLLHVAGNNARVSLPGGVSLPFLSGDLTGPIGVNVAEVRVVRTTNPNVTMYTSSLFTATDAEVGKVTAGFRSALKAGFCAIQGAEKPTTKSLLSSPKTAITTVGACTITWALSPDGCTTGATATGSGCGAVGVNKDLFVGIGANPPAASTATCGTEIGGPFGSTEVCRWNSLLRKATCVTVP